MAVHIHEPLTQGIFPNLLTFVLVSTEELVVKGSELQHDSLEQTTARKHGCVQIFVQVLAQLSDQMQALLRQKPRLGFIN